MAFQGNTATTLAVRMLMTTPRLRPNDIATTINNVIIPPLAAAGEWTEGVLKLFQHFQDYYLDGIGAESLSVFGKTLNATTSPLECTHRHLAEAVGMQGPPTWVLYRKYNKINSSFLT